MALVAVRVMIAAPKTRASHGHRPDDNSMRAIPIAAAPATCPLGNEFGRTSASEAAKFLRIVRSGRFRLEARIAAGRDLATVAGP
jgi:hypothetical protein